MQSKPFESFDHESLEKKFSDYFPGGSEGNHVNEGKEGEEGEEGNQGGNLLAGLTGSEGQGIQWEVLAAELLRQNSEQAGENKLSSNPSFNKNDFIFFLTLQACIDWHCYGIQTILKEEKPTYRLYRQGPDQKGQGLGDDNYLHLNAIMRLHHLICALEYFKKNCQVSSQENNNNSLSQPLNNVVSDSQKINFREQLKSFIVKDSKALSEEKFNQALHEDLKQFCENRNIAFEEKVGKSPMLNILKILGTVLYPKPEIITKINQEFFHRLIPVTKKTQDQKTKIDNYIDSLSKVSFLYAALNVFKSLIENDAHAFGAQARKIVPETAKNAWLVELIRRNEANPHRYVRHGALACESVRSSDRGEAKRNLAQIKQYGGELYGINLNTRVGYVWNIVDWIFSLNEGQNTIVDQTKSAFGDNFINIGQNFFAAWIGYYFLSPKNNDSCGRIFDLFSYLFFILRIIYALVFIGLWIISHIQSDLSSSTIETIETILLSVFCFDAGFNLIHGLMAYYGPLRRGLGEIVKQELESQYKKTTAISCASGLDRTGGAAFLLELNKLEIQPEEQEHKMLASVSALIANFSSPGAHGVKKQSDIGILPHSISNYLYNGKPSKKNKDPKLPANCFQRFTADKWDCVHVAVCLLEIGFFSYRLSNDTHSHDYFEILNKISDVMALGKPALFLFFHALMSKTGFNYQSLVLKILLFLTFVFYIYFLFFKEAEHIEEILPVVATFACSILEPRHLDLMSSACALEVDNPERREEVSQALRTTNETLSGVTDLVWDPQANHFFVRCTEFDSYVFVLAVMTLDGEGMSLTTPFLNLTGFCGANPWLVEGEVVCEDVFQPFGRLPCDVMSNATDPRDVQGFKDAVVSHGGIGSGAPMVWSNEYFAFWVMCSPSQDFYWLQSFVSSDPRYLLNTTEVLVEGQCPQQDWSALIF